MISDIVIIDDFFKSPDRVVQLAKKQIFLSPEEHTLKSNWMGKRTDELHKVEPDFFQQTVNDIFTKNLNRISNRYNFKFDSNVEMYFHFLTKECRYKTKWKHTDPGLIAGVIYLNKNPDNKSGTSIWKDGRKQTISNVYNRLVMYPSSLIHSANSGFGDNISNARLTMTFFIHQYDLSVSSI